MCELVDREGGRVDIVPGSRRCRDDDVGRVGEKGALDGVGDLVGQLDSADILCAERGKEFDGLEDLVGKLAGWDKDKGGGESGRVSLYRYLLARVFKSCM